MLDWEEVAKAELHVHLFGAIQSAVLLELARRNRVHLPVDTIAGLHEGFRFRDFDHFSEVLRTLRPCVQTAEDLELITYEAGRDLAAQHVRYAEVMVTPMGLELRGIRFPASLETMNRARARVRADFGLELRWIFDFNRSVPDEAECRYWADYATEVAIAGRDGGVVALGLSGAEDGNPPEQFAPWFERARAAGLHSVPHAGEHGGPDSVWGAINALGAGSSLTACARSKIRRWWPTWRGIGSPLTSARRATSDSACTIRGLRTRYPGCIGRACR